MHLFKRACPSVGHDGDDDFFVVLLYLHVLMTIVVTVMNSINVRPLILLFSFPMMMIMMISEDV